MDNLLLDKIIKMAFEEDMPYGDITTDNVFDDTHMSEAYMVAKEEGIACGIEIAIRAFELLDENVITEFSLEDGDPVEPGDIILEIKGKTKAILKAERTALNLIQRLSGISTATFDYVRETDGTDARIVDTRKTTPLLRMFEKYAVRKGGGTNHRFCLSDAAMLKDNHIDALGGINKAVKTLRQKIPLTAKIEVEVNNLEEVKQAVEAKADIIMLDNMSIDDMISAVEYINKRAVVEASGDVTLEKVREIAQIGVDIISVGKITHSIKSLDISMKMKAGNQ